MIYKFDKGGIVKLQNAGSVPEYGNIEQIAKYNREHGTNFYKMSQVLEHDKQQALQKSQNKKKSFWEILAGHPESAGEAILNKTIETANNAELPETRSKIYNDTGKAQLATTAGSLLTLPMLGEFSTYGLLGGASRLAGGFGGSAVGSYTLGKAGELGDRTFGTTWMKPAGQVIGGFAGWGPGSNIAYKGALDLAFKIPSVARIGSTDRFIGDVAGRVLGKNVNSTPFIPAQVKYYGPTMGKSYAAKTNPNLIDLDTWGRSEYDQLAKKYGYKDWREMILSDKGDYNEEYKQLIKDQIRRIQSDPQYSGKTIVVSNASLLKPSSGITFANTPVIPERSVMATRNNIRHPWESIEHGEEWWDSLQRKGTPLSIDNRFVSEIEGNKVIPFTPIPQKFVSTVHFDPRVKPLSRPISEAEVKGIPKVERNLQIPKNPIPVTLVNRTDSYIPIEDGMFVFESPEKAKRLSTIHFSQSMPVTAHGYGNWNNKTTTLIMPYGNMRKVTEPIGLNVMDTFFPNYNGLKVSTKGVKVLTGDRKVYEYYKSKGIDVEFSEKIEQLRKEYDEAYKEFNTYQTSRGWKGLDEKARLLSDKMDELQDKIQDIHTSWVEQNRVTPTLEDLQKLEKREGLYIGANPISENDYVPSTQRKLGFTYHSTPTLHFDLEHTAKDDWYYETLSPQQKKYVDWLASHKADYRSYSKGGSINRMIQNKH